MICPKIEDQYPQRNAKYGAKQTPGYFRGKLADIQNKPGIATWKG
jgi:hypothetical protein